MRASYIRAIAAMVLVVVAVAPSRAMGHVSHTVEAGESLWSIAAEDGLGVEELAAANGLSPDAELVAGQVIMVPPQTTATAAPVSTASGSGECVWQCDSTMHPHPTAETVAPEQVTEVAGEYGMSGPVVTSIAASESGFDNSLVSSAGARGVMQIMPDTWEFVEDNLATEPLDAASAADNVEAGVLYLHHLYHLMAGDGNATIAAYFQGPNRDGLLPETRDYVDTVRAGEASWAGTVP